MPKLEREMYASYAGLSYLEEVKGWHSNFSCGRRCVRLHYHTETLDLSIFFIITHDGTHANKFCLTIKLF